MTVTVQIHRAILDRLLHSPGGNIGKELRAAGGRVRNGAMQRCPVRTGRLRSSIRATQPTHRSATLMAVEIGTNVKYARFVELGTRFMRARPFLRPALEQEVR